MNTNNDKILKLLKDINKSNPDLEFGKILQTAMDEYKHLNNVDFHSLTSKEILTSLKEFQNKYIKTE